MSITQQIIQSVKQDFQVARDFRLRWWAMLAILAASLPIFIIADNHDYLAQAAPVLNWGIVIGLALWVKWASRGEVWFWTTLIVTTILVVPVIYFTHWKQLNIPFRAFGGIDVIAFIVLSALMAVARIVIGDNRNRQLN